MPKKFIKHKLLLDEGLPPRIKLPRLNRRFNVKHIAIDYGQPGFKDIQVYERARTENRLVVTFNDKDYKDLAGQSKNSGVIGISSNISIQQSL